jgi:hypothetical protein
VMTETNKDAYGAKSNVRNAARIFCFAGCACRTLMPTDLRYTSLLASPVAFRSPVLLILPTGHRCCQSIASRAEHEDKCAGAARVMLTLIRADQARRFAPAKLSGSMRASLRR